ncbi:MAG TPA: TldD/PmbA family protein, partial [Thermoplasmata archaeon]|nr:TldD/PmbA family protein [Thermoplasmata archaeon]
PEDANFESFPRPEPVRGSVADVYDARIANLAAEDLLDPALAAVNEASKMKGHVVSKAVVRAQEYEYRVANTLGVDAGHKGTLVFAAYYSTLAACKARGEGIAKAYATRLAAVDFPRLGRELVAKAKNTITAKPFEGSYKGPVILQASELGELLMNSVSFALSGEQVSRKRSPWAGKVGQKVAGDNVTIVDRPRMPGGVLSAAVDEEGIPTEDRALVDDGVLLGYANDHYNARRLKDSAGCGLRRGASTVEAAYAQPVSASVSNLTIAPGSGALDDLAADFDEVLVIERFASPSANGVSGAFGLEVRNASLVRNGDRTPLKFALLTGNVYEGLKHVIAIGGDVSPASELAGQTGIAYVPSVAFEGFELVGMT